MTYRAFERPPAGDHRPSLNAWRIEESLNEWIEAPQYLTVASRQENAAATVELVTGLDRHASKHALLELQQMQDEIDNEVFGPLIYQAREAYEVALLALARMPLVTT